MIISKLVFGSAWRHPPGLRSGGSDPWLVSHLCSSGRSGLGPGSGSQIWWGSLFRLGWRHSLGRPQQRAAHRTRLGGSRKKQLQFPVPILSISSYLLLSFSSSFSVVSSFSIISSYFFLSSLLSFFFFSFFFFPPFLLMKKQLQARDKKTTAGTRQTTAGTRTIPPP